MTKYVARKRCDFANGTIADFADLCSHIHRPKSKAKIIGAAQAVYFAAQKKKIQNPNVIIPESMMAKTKAKKKSQKLTNEELTKAFELRRNGYRNVEIHQEFPHIKPSIIDNQLTYTKDHPNYIAGNKKVWFDRKRKERQKDAINS